MQTATPSLPPVAARQLGTSAANLVLRASGLVLRFALTIFIAKVIGLESLGVASFLFAAIAITPALLSFGLHHRLHRDILGRPLEDAIGRLRDRLALHTGLVLLLAPAAALIAYSGWLDGMRHGVSGSVLLLAYLVASLELVSFEIHLGLISLERSNVANAFLFFRSSSWAPLFMAGALASAELRTMQSLLAFWAVGFAVAFAYLARALSTWPWRAVRSRRVDIGWLLRDLRGSLLVYTSDVSVLMSQFADRAIIGSLLGLREAGIYFFYWSFAAGIHQLVHSSVVQVSLPSLMALRRRRQPGEFAAAVRHNMLVGLAWSAVLGLACYGFVAVLLDHMHQPEIAAALYFLPILLLGAALRVSGDVLHQALYVQDCDRELAALNYVSAAGALVLTTTGILAFGFVGAPLAMAANALLVLAARTWVLHRALGR